MILGIVFLPLIAAIICGLFCHKISHKASQFITSISMLLVAILAYISFYQVSILNAPYDIHLLQWIDIESFSVNWSLKVDSLTAVMLIVVTTVSCLVHFYSIGYMHDDPHVPRFMAYLSLFTFFMLMLVTSNNLVQLFLGWEGVGLCSYLLIGFWFKKPSANKAAMKAFIVNRVADFAFALGIFTIFTIFNTVEFASIFEQAQYHKDATIKIFNHEYHSLTIGCLLLFVGCMGKSAQIGLHTWLADAMEGPTPVSALIHAATMVTAGVFLVARCSPIFEYAPLVLEIITIVGATTCLFAATIALTQNDIKKIIAYSTCSQLGYMFFACGVSAYNAGIFHLMTHAFFKALLFLGAGSVIHAMSGEQDINKMGGIYKKIPFTYLMMWIGSLALAGIYPFAGYFSKDLILEAAYGAGTTSGKFAFWCGIGAAFCTAFYSWRLLLKTFHGKTKANFEVMDHVHESPLVMTIPLAVLAIGALIAGFVGEKWLEMSELTFWHKSIYIDISHKSLENAHNVAGWVKLLPSLAGIIGVALAYLFYLLYPRLPQVIANLIKPLYLLSYNKYYFDQIYNKILVKPLFCLSKLLWQKIDVNLIDNLGPNGLAALSNKMAIITNRLQSGFIYHYSLVMLVSLVGFISWYIFY